MTPIDDDSPEKGPIDQWEFPEARPVSPLRLFMVTVALVFTAELAIMIWLEFIWGAPEAVEVAVDSIVLAIVITPLLYLTLYRPLNLYVARVREVGEAIRYSEKKYQTVVEHSPAGIFICRGGKLVFTNGRLNEMFRCDPQALVGTAFSELVAEEDRGKAAPMLAPGIEGGCAQGVEFRILPREGRSRWVTGRSTLIHYRGNQSVLGMVVDITPRKALEEELRRVSMQRLEVQEEERGRLARELHDGVGQSLSGIKFLVEHTLGRAFPNERREDMGQLRALVPKIQDTVEEVRRLSMVLRPATLDDLGLLATITWFLRELAAACPHLQVDHVLAVEESQVPDPLKITIYRTLQEALNNAAKHCGECRVEVTLVDREGRLHLEVLDDGVGFDPEAVRRRDPVSRGFGLVSMRERVELSGGEFALEASPGGGTRVQAAWPEGAGSPTES